MKSPKHPHVMREKGLGNTGSLGFYRRAIVLLSQDKCKPRDIKTVSQKKEQTQKQELWRSGHSSVCT